MSAEDGPATLVELLRERARADGGREAFVFLPDGEAEGDRLTYAGLDARARAVAALLDGVPAGERALLLLQPGMDYLAAFFGCLYAGLVPVPAYPPHPARLHRPNERLLAIAADSRAQVALTSSAVLARLGPALSGQPGLSAMRWVAADRVDLQAADGARVHAPAPQDLAFLQYTSGSTGTPKGVAVSHRALLRQLRFIAEVAAPGPEETCISWLPPYHDMGLVGCIFLPLYLRARQVSMPPAAFLQVPFRWLSALGRYGRTFTAAPNFAFELCVRRVTAAQRASLDLSGWQLVVNGAEPIRADTVRRFTESFAPCGLRPETILPAYGMAEVTLMATGTPRGRGPRYRPVSRAQLRQRRAAPPAPGDEQVLVGSGRAGEGRLAIVEEEGGAARAVPAGRVGEIWLQVPSVAEGYFGRPEESERQFRARLDTGEGPFLRTGDLGFLDEDGELFVVGREKELIILRGQNVYPHDVEDAVAGAHPALRAGGGAAFGVEAEREEQLVLVHEVDPHAAASLSAEEVAAAARAALWERLELDLWALVLVRAGAVPRTSSGKLQRRACREQWQAGELPVLAEWRRAAAPAAEEPPATPTEARLAEIFREVLGAERISAGDDFFQLGGQSLLGAQLLGRIHAAFGLELPVPALFEAPTVRALARRIDEARPAGPAPSPEAPIRRLDASAVPPLSVSQHRLWLLHQLEPESPAYHLAFALRFTGPLDPPALSRALGLVVERQAALRTRLAAPEGVPVQLVDPPPEVRLEPISLEGEADPEEALRRRMVELGRAPYDLENGPPFRAALFRLDPRRHALLFAVHHAAFDGWSARVLLDELRAAYPALAAGAAPALPPLPVEYRDFAAWQAERLEAGRLEEDLRYWGEALRGAPGTLELPADRPRPEAPTADGGRTPFSLSAEATARLRALARGAGATLHMALLAGWSALLSRLTGQADLVVGSAAAGRGRPELEPLIGFFVNTLPLRVDLSGDPAVATLLQRVRGAALGALAHQEAPYERLADAGAPALRTLLVLQPQGAAHHALPGGVTIEAAEVDLSVAKLDLELQVQEEGERLGGFLQYSAATFEPATAARLSRQLSALLEDLGRDGSRRLSQLSLMDGAERRKVVVEWNATGRAYPAGVTLRDLLEAQAERTPSAVAVRSGAEALTYRALDERANQVAHALGAAGAGPETCVGVCAERSLELVVALVGVIKAGAAYLPLEPADPRERLGTVIAEARPRAILAQARFRGALPPSEAPVLSLDAGGEPWRQPTSRPEVAIDPEQLAYVIYTSGSTGRPKGAMNGHRGICNRLLWMQEAYRLVGGDRILQKTPFTFDVSVWEFFWPLIAGAAVVVAPPGAHRDSARLARLIQEEGVTVLHFVPSMLRPFLDEPEAGGCRTLRLVVCSGEALPFDLKERCLERLPAAALENLYGPTEAAVDVSFHSCARGGEDPVPIGRPIANLRLHVLDRSLQPVPPGTPGDLYIGGVGVGRGYLGRPDLTADRFLPDPFGPPGARLYRTGDLARTLEGGVHQFLGRADDQVKVRGFRIELGEIEAELARHPSVRASAVAVRQRRAGEALLWAYVVLREGRALDAADLRAALGARLPEYMIPAGFSALPALPLSSSGKLDRRALPAPDLEAAAEASFEPPRTEAERVLAGILAAALGLPRVGRQDGFLALGGDSILALQVVSRARAAGLRLEPRQVLTAPSLEALAALAAPASAAASPPGPAAAGAGLPRAQLDELAKQVGPLEDAFPLTPMQEGLLAHALAHPDSTVAFEQYVLTLKGEVDAAALERAWRSLMDRHPALRSSFHWEGGPAPLQLIHPRADLPFSAPAGELEAEGGLARFCAEDLRRGFDLRRPPLFRVHLARAGGRRHLVWSFHHLLLDGWSAARLLDELFDAYAAAAEGRAPAPAPPPPFGEVRSWHAAQPLEAADAFFRDQLSGVTAATPLGVDRTVAGAPAEDFLEVRRTLPAELGPALEAFARRHGVTLAALATGAFGLLLGRQSGTEDVVFGTTLSGRSAPLPGIDASVGLLINTLPLRVRLPGERRVLPWLRSIQEQLAELQRHEHAPLARAQRMSAVPPGRPLFQGLLVVENYPVADRLRRARGGISIERLEVYERTNFPLTVVVMPGERVVLRAIGEASRLDSAALGRLLEHLEEALRGLAGAPEALLGERSVLGAEERRRLLADWAAAPPPPPAPARVHERVAAAARAAPDAPAVISDEGRLSYGELDARAEALARRLRALGVGPEVAVGTYAERSPRLITGMLAVLKAGGAYQPMDPEAPAARVSWMLEDARAPVVLVDPALARRLSGYRGQVVVLDGAGGEAGPPVAAPTDAEQLAYVIYTSGSTGRPKGVAVPHRGLENLVQWYQAEYRVAAGDRTTWICSPAFDVSVSELWPYLTAGASIFIPGPAARATPAALAGYLREHRIDLSFLPTPLAEMLLDEPLASTSLRALLTAGDRLRRRPPRLPFPFVNLYGPTECSVFATGGEARPDEPGPPDIGRPIAGIRTYVLDRRLRPVPEGAAGELYLGGEGVARCYLARPDLSAERFVPDPFSAQPGRRLYRTGDLVRWMADGRLEFIGRGDQQVKIRGFRVEPGEIETALMRHPGVREVGVAKVEGQGGGVLLVAYLVPRGAPPPPEALAAFLQAELPPYMVPSRFVAVDALPLTASGKVDRAALAARPVERPPAEPPRDELEARLSRIWAEVMGLETVGVHDGFFELGGDSIVALQIAGRARQAGLSLSPAQVLAHPTVAALAEALRALPAAALEAEGPPRGAVPLTPIQRWFFERCGTSEHQFNQALLIQLGAGVDAGRLAEAARAALGHHDAFRLRFARGGEGWTQRYADGPAEVPVEVVDLRQLPEPARAAEREARIRAAQASLHVGDGPLARAVLFQDGHGPGSLLLVAHHLVVDGVSWRVIVEDVQQAYAGGPARLPPRTASYQRWAEVLARQGPAGDGRAAAPWLAMAGKEAAPLPRDLGGGPGVEGTTRWVTTSLEREVTQVIVTHAAASRMTVHEVLVAALAQVLGQWSGADRLWLTLEGHGREESAAALDVSRTVGWFTAMFPLCLEVGREAAPAEALIAAKEQVRAVRGVDYGLCRYLGPEEVRARLAALPAPEVAFNYLGQVPVPGPGAIFASWREARAGARHPELVRPHLLEVDATIVGGGLEMAWAYSEAVHRRETIEALAQRSLARLRLYAQHLASGEAARYSPRDFPLAKLDQEKLDALLDELG